jgi:predicted Zn-dependent protease
MEEVPPVSHLPSDRIYRRTLTRRDFLWLASASAAVAGVTALGGCAVDPVTGEQGLMLVSEGQEVQIDRQQSPHQFSADYGPSQDSGLQSYVNEVGTQLARRSHRPQMPYSFRAVNATYVNAYAFPGGSIAATRGILLELDNEAELAALLGHEIGHVNARHTAEQMSKQVLAQVAIAGVGIAAQASGYGQLGSLAQDLGGIGAGALLAHYSRDNEREADALGMEYLSRDGLNPSGMVGLMELLQQQSKARPGALELMFATHPMSDERLATARQAAETKYAAGRNLPVRRERYMDQTARLRRLRGPIEAMQRADTELKRKRYPAAEESLQQALRQAPRDYAALAMMAKTQIALDRPARAREYAQQAKAVYPREAQGHHLAAVSALMRNDYDDAIQDLDTYERLLPGNPSTVFLKGVAKEGIRDVPGAAREYQRYLRSVNKGSQAQHAHQRLVSWGYLKS